MWNLPNSRYIKAFEPTLTSKKARCCSEDTQLSSFSSDDDEEQSDSPNNNSSSGNTTIMFPDIIPVSSLGSFSDSTTASSSAAASRCASPATTTLSCSPTGVSPRSIFSNYWSLSNHHEVGGRPCEEVRAPSALVSKSGGGEEELLHDRLQSLSLPFGDDDADAGHANNNDPSSSSNSSPPPPTTRLSRSSSAQAAPSPKMVNTLTHPKPSLDDSTIEYGRNTKIRSPSSTPRRQIMPHYEAPTLPAKTASKPYYNVRKWSSTSALMKRPTSSCLRPSRYSCSMIDERELSSAHCTTTQESTTTKTLKSREDTKVDNTNVDMEAIAARAQLPRSKSVSFYSQVSVFEFVKYTKGMEEVPKKDWSKYFAA